MLQTHLSLGLSEQAAEPLVSQGPVGELGALPGLRLLQPQLELPQGAQLLHQLPLTRPAGLEIQLQVQGGTSGLLSQGGAVRLLLTHIRHIRSWILNTCETQTRDETNDCTCLYLSVRLSKVFLTKGDFFGRVELSLSLRYS